jgi:hypothetical protein
MAATPRVFDLVSADHMHTLFVVVYVVQESMVHTAVAPVEKEFLLAAASYTAEGLECMMFA